MSERLYKVVTQFVATEIASGGKRTFHEGETLFAEDPPQSVDGCVEFEIDNQGFQVAYDIFVASTELAVINELLDTPSIGAPPLPRCTTCGHQKVEHTGAGGRCTAMNVKNNRHVPCECEKFARIP